MLLSLEVKESDHEPQRPRLKPRRRPRSLHFLSALLTLQPEPEQTTASVTTTHQLSDHLFVWFYSFSRQILDYFGPVLISGSLTCWWWYLVWFDFWLLIRCDKDQCWRPDSLQLTITKWHMIFINISRHYRLTVCWSGSVYNQNWILNVFFECLHLQILLWFLKSENPKWRSHAMKLCAGVKWSWEFLTENLRNLVHIVSRSFTLKHESYSVFWFWMLKSLNIWRVVWSSETKCI